jgi:hypothetical protein
MTLCECALFSSYLITRAGERIVVAHMQHLALTHFPHFSALSAKWSIICCSLSLLLFLQRMSHLYYCCLQSVPAFQPVSAHHFCISKTVPGQDTGLGDTKIFSFKTTCCLLPVNQFLAIPKSVLGCHMLIQ